MTTIDAESLYSCGFPDLSRFDSAWLSEAGFRRLLPVCCPSWLVGRACMKAPGKSTEAAEEAPNPVRVVDVPAGPRDAERRLGYVAESAWPYIPPNRAASLKTTGRLALSHRHAKRPGGRTLSAPRPRRTEHARFHEEQKRAGRGYRVLSIVRSASETGDRAG